MSDIDKLNQARVFNLAAHQLTPLIESRRVRSVEELLTAYRSGQKDLLTEVARLEAYSSIIEDITSKQQEFETLANRVNREKD